MIRTALSRLLPARFLPRAFAPASVPASAPARAASSMVIETSKLSVLHGPLQPHTVPGDSTHPTGFFRDGYCWGVEEDVGQHYVAGVVTKEFLEFSWEQGNDLTSRRPGFVGLREGCRWCLCVARWKEALLASQTRGERVVPRVDLAATAMHTLRSVDIEDLMRFQWRPERHATTAAPTTGGTDTGGTGGRVGQGNGHGQGGGGGQGQVS